MHDSLKIRRSAQTGAQSLGCDVTCTAHLRRHAGSQIEAEGLGKMAVAAGYSVVGLPALEVHHSAIHKKEQPQWD